MAWKVTGKKKTFYKGRFFCRDAIGAEISRGGSRAAGKQYEAEGAQRGREKPWRVLKQRVARRKNGGKFREEEGTRQCKAIEATVQV